MVNEATKNTLHTLCTTLGWSYAVFWGFDPHNLMSLTMEDAYCEEHAAGVVGSMLLQVHQLGHGVIGAAAVDGKHRWMSAHAISWDISEFGLQFASGIKTIVVVPVELRGVLQLGSIQEISETRELTDQVRMCFQETVGVVPRGSGSSSFISDAADQYELFTSMSPSQNFNFGDVSTVDDVGSSSVFNWLDVQLRPYTENLTHDNGNGESLIQPGFASLVENTQDLFDDQFEVADLPPSSFDEFQINDLTQWLADSSELCVSSLDAMLSDETPHNLGVDGISSVLSDGFSNAQRKEPACSFKSCLSNTSHRCGEVETFAVNANNDKLLAECEVENLVGSVGRMNNISERTSDTVAAPRKGLFSELGLEHLLKDEWGVSSSCSSKLCNDQWPPSKKRKVEGYEMINNYSQRTDSLWGPKLMQHPCISGQIKDFSSLKQCMPKVQPGLSVAESYGMDAKSCISAGNSLSRKLDEPSKPLKKRAKPGESKRPRPKDRQQIAERINELRDLIPNATKLSIDALLGRTIKHMDYLQNLTKHAEKVKQVHEPKLIGQGNGLIQKSGGRGATWAFEVGGSDILCPIVVEDLGHPGHMLIEMLCEEREYFLEMADTIKGFGLTILKGIMEERSGKIWAQFTVEAKKGVERVQVFMSLMQLFHGPTSNEIIEPEKYMNGVSTTTLWGKYQQHGVPISI
ncbi:hypothetical protein RND81_06G251500 [Saponaria officinalis]|uniref:BHLH domain-containing protein n=1 Tax=Saponaria officinalis TaxID=3572 RepID=A0AAW1KAN2_SAPOF